MAVIKENFIAFSSDKVYNQHISEVTPDSICFVFRKGQEKLITQGNTFYFVPNNGSIGQVLKKRDGYFSWDDLYSVRVSNSVENLSSEYTYYVLEMSSMETDGKVSTVHFGEFAKGQTCTVYMTRNASSTYAPIIHIDETKYISLNNQYDIKLENVGEWVSAKFFSTGGNVYVEINDLGAETDRLAKLVDSAYLMKVGVENSTSKPTASVMANDTNIAKNQYEFVVGKHNNGTRDTSASFGVTNTLLTVGNGLNASNRHDALQVLQSGEMMIVDLESEGEYYKKKMFSLQAKLKEYEDDITDLKEQLSEANETISSLTERLDNLEKIANQEEDDSEMDLE